jgi:hypothetical protein
MNYSESSRMQSDTDSGPKVQSGCSKGQKGPELMCCFSGAGPTPPTPPTPTPPSPIPAILPASPTCGQPNSINPPKCSGACKECCSNYIQNSVCKACVKQECLPQARAIYWKSGGCSENTTVPTSGKIGLFPGLDGPGSNSGGIPGLVCSDSGGIAGSYFYCRFSTDGVLTLMGANFSPGGGNAYSGPSVRTGCSTGTDIGYCCFDSPPVGA